MQDSFNRAILGQSIPDDVKSKGLQKVVNGSKSEFSSLRGGLMLILAFIEMINSSAFKSKVCKQNFIETISVMIENSESSKGGMILDEFRRALFQVAESIAKHNKILISQQKEIIENLLPVLVKKIESDSADVRFLSLKLFTDYITQYLCEEKIYNCEENNETTQAINELILKKLFVHYGIILTDKDPMPLFGLKLLSVIVERNQGFVTILKKLKLISVLLEYFAVGHAKFNAFTVKIVKQIVQSREVDLEELVKLQVIEKINGIMTSVMSNHQEWCSDHLLEIMNEILHQAADLKKNEPATLLP